MDELPTVIKDLIFGYCDPIAISTVVNHVQMIHELTELFNMDIIDSFVQYVDVFPIILHYAVLRRRGII